MMYISQPLLVFESKYSKQEDAMKKIPAEDARQGRKGAPVLVILLCSLLLAILVWVGVEGYGRIASESNHSFANDEKVPDVSAPVQKPASAQ